MPQKILLVDDEEAVRKVLASVLRRADFEVHTAANGKGLFQWLQDEVFDLVICDIFLINEDGLDLLTEIKTGHPNLPVLMVTGVGYDEELMLKASARGASGFLSKPMSLSQMVLEIRRTLKAAEKLQG